MAKLLESVQRSAKVFVRGCEKLVIPLAYLFCLALVGSCLARFAYFLADLSMCDVFVKSKCHGMRMNVLNITELISFAGKAVRESGGIHATPSPQIHIP